MMMMMMMISFYSKDSGRDAKEMEQIDNVQLPTVNTV